MKLLQHRDYIMLDGMKTDELSGSKQLWPH
jgi:hypothetical protein